MPDCLSGGTGSTPVATATGVMTRREGRSSPKRVQAGSNPVTPASLKSEHGIAAGASGLQPDDASSTLAARSKILSGRKSSSGQDTTLPTSRPRVRVPPSAPMFVVRWRSQDSKASACKADIGSAILPATSRVCAGVAQWEELGPRKSVIGVRIAAPAPLV